MTGSNKPNRAVDEIRTRDLHLGKVALYQLSYNRIVLLTDMRAQKPSSQGVELQESVTPRKHLPAF